MKKLVLFLTLFFLFGCAGMPPPVIEPHRVTNVALDPVAARSIRSLAVFPVYDPDDYEDVSERIGEIISLQILKIGRFKIIEPIKISELMERQRISLSGRLSMEQMLKVGREMGVDAIIIGQLTAYRPYEFHPERIVNRESPTIIGLNLKMVTVNSHNVVWAASDTFNGRDESIAVLVQEEEQWKIKQDIDFLTTLLVRELTRTLNY